MPDLAEAVRVSPFALEPYRMAVGPLARPGAAAAGTGAAGIGADWFGPLKPLAPIAPKEVAGRQFDYPPGFNLATRPRAYEPIGFGELRALADTYDLIRIIIETRKDQMTRLEWNVRPREGRLAPGDARVRRIESFFARPDGARGWDSWLRELLEDLFVIDAPALWCERSRSGALLHLHPIDGASLKRVIDDWGRTPAPPLPAYQQVLHGMPAVDYTARDILYRPRNGRVHKVYGFSPVEQILVTVNIALRRQIYQLQYYTEGNIPEALIGAPESWTPEQIERFQLYWDGIYSGNTAQRRHAKFVPGGLAKTFIPTKEPELTGAADEWLARLCCFAFSVSPQPFVRMMNRATAAEANDQAQAEGMAPLQQWVKSLVDEVIAREFGAADLEFRWKDDRASDQASAASVAADYVKTGIKSVNEVRGELGLDPVAGGERPTVLTAQGPVALGTAGAGQSAAKLARYNQNHYGPGPQGGQFAPTGEDGAGGDVPTQVAAADESDNGSGPERDAVEPEFIDPDAPVRQKLYGIARDRLRAIDPSNAAIPSLHGPDWVPSNDDVNNMQDALGRAIEDRAAQIADHAYQAHVLERGEFPEIGSEAELQLLAQSIMKTAKPEVARGGQTLFYQSSTNALVIVNLRDPEVSTIFRPTNRRRYVDDQL